MAQDESGDESGYDTFPVGSELEGERKERGKNDITSILLRVSFFNNK